jgi:hypothetical protein
MFLLFSIRNQCQFGNFSYYLDYVKDWGLNNKFLERDHAITQVMEHIKWPMVKGFRV